MTVYDWTSKLVNLESIIDQRVEEDIKNYDVLGQMAALVKTCTSIQLQAMLGYVRSCPELGKVPDQMNSQIVTIYDIIQLNMTNILIAHGEQYYKDTYVK